MQKPFRFIVDCQFKQRRYTRLAWKKSYIGEPPRECAITGHSPALEASGVTAKDFENVLHASKDREHETYDAFENADPLQDLYKLVVKIRNGKDAKALVKQWVAQYGFLGCNAPTVGAGKRAASWEALSDFLKEADHLATLWQRYGQATRRDLPALQEWIRFVPRPHDEPFEDVFWPKNAAVKTSYAPFPPPNVETISEYDVFFAVDGDITGTEALPLRYYQHAAARYILYDIEERLTGARLVAPYYRQTAVSPTEDAFEITPVIRCHTLLQALYMQFYFLLTTTGTQAVCASCGVLFQQPRPNTLYCSGTCYNTAKSRRFRGRKKIRGGKN